MTNRIQIWMQKASLAERDELARRAGTTRQYLYLLANNWRTMRADLAGRIEEAARELRKGAKDRLPKIVRAELCDTCRMCPYAQTGKRAKNKKEYKPE